VTTQIEPTGPARIQLRVEAFKFLQPRQLRPPNSIRSSAAFGSITSTYDPRQMQLGVKVLW